jgi:hypothetical protein
LSLAEKLGHSQLLMGQQSSHVLPLE